MKNIILFMLAALFAVSCASIDDRTPASEEQKQDYTHQKFQGYFDKPDQ